MQVRRSAVCSSVASLAVLIACGGDPAPRAGGGGGAGEHGGEAGGEAGRAGAPEAGLGGGVASAGAGGASGGAAAGATAGSAGGAAGAADAGAAGSGGAGGATGGAAGSAAAGQGGASKCAGAGVPICLGFESGLGAGVTKSGPSIGVDATRAYRGASSLHIKMNGQDTNVIALSPPSNTGVIWGRYFLYTTGSNKQHGSLVRLEGSGSYRVGMSAYRFMGVYNPGDLVTECNPLIHPDACTAKDRDLALIPLNRWTCVEWEMNAAAGQPTNVYKDGVKIGLVPYQATWPKVTSFAKMDLGLAMYHAIDEPFEMWIDEVAVDTKRIGCDR